MMVVHEYKKDKFLDRSGFDALHKEFKSSSQFTRVLIGVFQERAQLESDYAKGLSKLHGRLSKAVENVSGTIATAWQKTSETLQTELKVHQDISEILLHRVLPPSKDFITTVDKEIKPIVNEVDVASSRLLTSRRVEWKLRKKALTSYRSTCLSLASKSGSHTSSSTSGSLVRRGGTLLSAGVSGVSAGAFDLSSQKLQSQAKSTTLPTPANSSTLSGGLLANHPSIPEKVAHSLWQSVLFYYRSSLASEDARIEWHATIFQNALRLYALERARLADLCLSLSTYRTTISDALIVQQKAFNETREVCSKVDKDKDFTSFHDMTFHDATDLRPHSSMSSQRTVTRPISVDLSMAVAAQNPNKLAPIVKTNSPSRYSQQSWRHRETATVKPQPVKQEKLAVIGQSLQYLVSLPGEVEALYSLTQEQKNISIQRVLEKRLFVMPPGGDLNAVSNPKIISENLEESTFKLEQAAFSRQLLMTLVEILVREAVKEERTKQGLTNLVQVYSTTPLYTDEVTLKEARRRLFISRCKLAHLKACRARLALLFNEEDAKKGSKSPSAAATPGLQKRLIGAGFEEEQEVEKVPKILLMGDSCSALKQFPLSVLVRAVSVLTPPDELDTLLKHRLDWPPVPSEMRELENIPSDELDIFNPFFASSTDITFPEAFKSSLFTSAQKSLSLSKFLGTESTLTDSDFEDDDLESISISPPPTPLPLASSKTDCTKKSSMSPRKENAYSNSPRKPVIVANAQRKLSNASTSSSPRKPTLSVKSRTTAISPSKLDKQPKPLKFEPMKNNLPNKLKPTPPKTLTKSTNPMITTSMKPKKCLDVVEPIPEPKVDFATLKVDVETQPIVEETVCIPNEEASRVMRNEKSNTKKKPFFNKFHCNRSHEAQLDEEEKHSLVTPGGYIQAFSTSLDEQDAFLGEPRLQSSPTKPAIGPLVINDIEADPSSHSSALSAAAKPSPSIETKKRISAASVFSRFGLCRQSSGKRKQRPKIEAPWRIECQQTNVIETNVKNPVHGNGQSLKEDKDGLKVPDPVKYWPSIASLHCIGWAKVISSYAAQQAGDLTLLEGEIVSILKKLEADWWLGEAGGKCGRFPVANIEEF